MRESRLQFDKNCSKSSLGPIRNASMVAEIRHLLRSGRSIHGGQIQDILYMMCLFIGTNCIIRVPKELIARFVKICPTCQVRRGGSRLMPPTSRRSPSRLVSRPLKLPSPPISRRESTFASQFNRTEADYFGHLHDHSGWLDSHQNVKVART